MSKKDIGRHLAEINNLMHRQIIKSSRELFVDSSDSEAISGASSCIIAYLHDHSSSDVFQRDLENEFQVRRSTMSKALSLLELKGYIQREAVESDRRLRKIVLTEKAELVADKLKFSRSALEQKLTHSISKEELEQFRSTLEKIKLNLTQEDNI